MHTFGSLKTKLLSSKKKARAGSGPEKDPDPRLPSCTGKFGAILDRLPEFKMGLQISWKTIKASNGALSENKCEFVEKDNFNQVVPFLGEWTRKSIWSSTAAECSG